MSRDPTRKRRRQLAHARLTRETSVREPGWSRRPAAPRPGHADEPPGVGDLRPRVSVVSRPEARQSSFDHPFDKRIRLVTFPSRGAQITPNVTRSQFPVNEMGNRGHG